MMNDFIENTKTFVRNVNSSLIERSQQIDSFEILLDRMLDHQSRFNAVDSDFERMTNMLEVLIRAMKYAQETDEDMLSVYEFRDLKTFEAKQREQEKACEDQ